MSISELYNLFLKSSGISTDTRKIEPNTLFFALKGSNFDGNKYAKIALENGASYAIIDNEEFKINDQYITVPDTLKTLQDLAKYHRHKFSIPIIAIAGSNGKTTTKELLTAVLSTSLNTHATPGNFNNEIGVPLTLLKMKKNTEAAVIEMGAKNLGDIEFLCQIVDPNYGLVTNTGKDHLETFLTIENTRKANAELYLHLKANNGTAFACTSDEILTKDIQSDQTVITYGSKGDYAGRIESNFPQFTVSYLGESERIMLNTQLTGSYNLDNIMAAIAVGKHFGISDSLIKRAIERYKPANNRSQILTQHNNTFILDAYNANPTSMEAALQSFKEINATKKGVILGDMLELGKSSFEEHLLIVLLVKSINPDVIVLVGDEFGKVKDRLNCHHFSNIEEAKEWFNNQNFSNHAFLLKGSRGIAVEKIID